MTISYDASDFNELTVLFRWRGTIMPAVLCRPVMWLLLSAHIGFLYLHIYQQDVVMPHLPWKLTAVPTALLTFFLVFYSGNCYARYFQLHAHCVGINGLVMVWANLIQTHFGHQGPHFKWNLMRLYLAGLYSHYSVLGGDNKLNEEGVSQKGLSEAEWAVLKKYLTAAEIQQLRSFSGFKPFVPIVWALSDIKTALWERDGNILQTGSTPPSLPKDTPAAQGTPTASGRPATAKDVPTDTGSPKVKSKVRLPVLTTMPQLKIFDSFESAGFAFRAHCGQTAALMAQPVPYPYFHTLKLLLLLSLMVVGYAQVQLLNDKWVTSLPLYAMVCGIMIGLQEVAIAMSDPFGDDAIDLDVPGYLRSANTNAVAFLSLFQQQRPAGQHTPLTPGMDNPLIVSKGGGSRRDIAQATSPSPVVEAAPAEMRDMSV